MTTVRCFEKGDRNKRLIVVLAISALFLLTAKQAIAVAFRGLAEDGTRHFVCESSCGRVRVKKIGKDRYRIFSISYSGELAAGSEKEAAEKACGERDMSGSKRSPDSADRGGGCS